MNATRWFLIAIMALMCAASVASATIISEDFDCNGGHPHRVLPTDQGYMPIARDVAFEDASGVVYYRYFILCDGTVVEWPYNGDVKPIGHVPVWAAGWFMSPVAESTTGGASMQVYASGHLAMSVIYDGIPGHGAVVTTYEAPLN